VRLGSGQLGPLVPLNTERCHGGVTSPGLLPTPASCRAPCAAIVSSNTLSPKTRRPIVVRPAPLSDSIVLSPNVLAVRHWDRLLGGALYAATARVDWATLLRRSFDVEVLACAHCGGRLRVLGEVTDAAAIRLVLESLGLPTAAPCAARARDPTDLLAEQTEH
jgi:hypothetical protein